ncbi:hypothetical protein B566_EDAN002965, partial [Ephemera danica]
TSKLFKNLIQRYDSFAYRQEISSVRSNGGSSNQQRNDHLTLQWLQGTVREMRDELQTELSAAHNTSELRAQEVATLTSDVAALRSDVSSSRADLETLRAEQTRNSVQSQQSQQELVAAIEHYKKGLKSSPKIQFVMFQVESAQADWTQVLQKRSKRVMFLENDTVPPVQTSMTPHTDELERRVRRLEKKIKNALWSRAQAAGRSAEHAELLKRVATLEEQKRSNDRALFNVSQEIEGLKRVQLTTSQLMESMSALESRFDIGLPELQREVSRLEFELAQSTSSIQNAKDAEDQQNSLLKSFSDNISRLEKNLNADRALLIALRQELSSAGDLATQQQQGEPSQQQEGANNSEGAVRRFVRDLGRLESQYEHLVHTLPKDCESVTGPSGEYMIAPALSAPEARGSAGLTEEPLLTWCDQDTGAGGWTVVQRRNDGLEQFNRPWAEYETGFGAPAGEFWLGNSALHRLTADNCSSLRVDLRDIYGESWFAEYTDFSVSSAQDGYRLWVSGYQGNASDAFSYQNMMQFSAVDSDRDISNTHCAANYEGGWWFSHCQHVNLNGRYNLGLTWFDSSRNEWIAVAWSEMKVRRRAGCSAANK